MGKISIFDIETEEEYLKNKDIIDINEINEYDHNALISSDLEKIKWLIKYEIDLNYPKSFPVIFEHEENPEIQRYLVESGADIHNSDHYGLISFVKDLELIKILLEKGININQKDYEGNNYLFRFWCTWFSRKLRFIGIPQLKIL